MRGRKISMIFQEPMTSLDPLYTIGSQLIEPIRRHRELGRGAARMRRRVRLLELVQIPEPERRMKSYPHEMSGGQRQRVMIAMALANDPDILIADEPTTALDVTIQAQILVLACRAAGRLGMAIVFITHDLGIVRRLADRVYVMRRGEVVEEGTPRPSSPRLPHPYTKMLLAAEPDRPQGAAAARGAGDSARTARSRSPSLWAAACSAVRRWCCGRSTECRPVAAPGADDRHRRRVGLRQVDARAGAAQAVAERAAPSASRTATCRMPTGAGCGRCAANCSSCSRIRSARCRRA